MKRDYSESRFLAIAPYYWGRGDTAEDAIKQLRAAGFRGKARGNVKIYVLPEGAVDGCVTELGDVQWRWREGYTGDQSARGEWRDAR